MTSERTVYVGHLSDKVTEDILKELFVQIGPLFKVTLKQKERDSFAMVEFADEESVLFAVDMLDGVQLYNSAIKVLPRNGSQQEVEYKRRSKQSSYTNDTRKRDHSGNGVHVNHGSVPFSPSSQSFVLPPPPIPPLHFNMGTPQMPPPPPPNFGGSNRSQPGYKISQSLARPASSGDLDKWHSFPGSRANNMDFGSHIRSAKPTFPQKSPNTGITPDNRYHESGNNTNPRNWEQNNRYHRSRSSGSGGNNFHKRY